MLLAACALLVRPAPARAQGAPVFVDVNNNGVYDPSTDIASGAVHNVDIQAIIQKSGWFNTRVSQGAYYAPCRPASLVIPAGVTRTLAQPLSLKAGVNLTVNGTLNAPNACLSACGKLDLTGSSINFVYELEAGAGCDAILTNATLTGSDPCSEICVSACRDLSAQNGPFALDGAYIGLTAGCSVNLTSAGLTTTSSGSFAGVGANGTVSLSGYTAIAASLDSTGEAEVVSWCGDTAVQGDAIDSGSVELCANCNLDFTGTAISSSATCGSISAEAGGALTGNAGGTAVYGPSFCAESGCDLDLSNAAITTTTDGASISSCQGGVTLVGAAFTSPGGVRVGAGGSINASGMIAAADHILSLDSQCGCVLATGSNFGADVGAPDTEIQVCAPGNVDVSSSFWQVPAEIEVASGCGNITATNGSYTTTGSPGAECFYVGGGTITITGSTVNASYAPGYVTVVR